MCDQETKHQTLASASGLGSVTLCACGTVTLHVGGISVRMEPTAFAQTAEMCRTALAALEVQAQLLQAARAGNSSLMTH
jgi:hypothetical protein